MEIRKIIDLCSDKFEEAAEKSEQQIPRRTEVLLVMTTIKSLQRRILPQAQDMAEAAPLQNMSNASFSLMFHFFSGSASRLYFFNTSRS